MAVAVYGLAIFVAALVALVVVPATARRTTPQPPPVQRPDTITLAREAALAESRLSRAQNALRSAHEALARTAAEPSVLDTLPTEVRLKRDSLAEAMGSLARLLRRTEEAPLVASWRALGASRLLQGIPRVRQIVDSLVEVDRSRSDFGAAGGVDPIFVALTARAAELGKELEAIAEARRASLRAEMDRLPPIARPPRQQPMLSIDTTSLVASRDSADVEVGRTQRALARARAVHRDLDLEAEREREQAAKGASPLAMLAAALVLGLALGYALALAGEVRRPRVGDAREATIITNAPLLVRIRGHVEIPERMRRRADRELSPLIDLASGSYDVLHKELAAGGAHIPLVAVVSDHAGVAATVSANLAAAAAQLARTTLVVDMDFETHAVSAILRTRRSPGLSDLLSRKIEWPEALRSAMVGRDRSVDVLPSGRNAPRGTLQSAAGELASELAHLVRRYELVIVSAPHSRFGVVPAAASAVPVVVLCVRSGRTGVSALEQLVRSVTEHGAAVRGVVMWETEDPVPTALSEADRAAGRDSILSQTTEAPVSGPS